LTYGEILQMNAEELAAHTGLEPVSSALRGRIALSVPGPKLIDGDYR